MTTPYSYPQFCCSGVTVNFIYSFGLKARDRFVIDEDDLERIIKTTIKDKRFHGDVGIPDCRKGLMPHIDFPAKDIAYIFLDCEAIAFGSRPGADRAEKAGRGKFQPMKARVDDSLDVEVESILRLFPTASICLISVRIPRSPENCITAGDILKLLNLVKSRQGDCDPATLRLADGSELRVFNLFYQTLKQLTAENHGLQLLEEAYETGSVLRPPPGLAVPEERQNPWVVTVAEVGDELAKAFCAPGDFYYKDPAGVKLAAIMQYQRDIAPLLFRAPGTSVNALDLEPAYLDPPYSGGVPSIFSMAVDARIFVQASRRSILCICKDRDQDPAQFFIPDLLKLSEITRARWHTLIMMNKVMDVYLRHLRKDGSAKDPDFAQQVARILELRRWLTTSLEDPGVYVISGDALAKIYEFLGNTFRINELRDLVTGKLGLFSSISRDVQEHRWLTERPSAKASAKP